MKDVVRRQPTGVESYVKFSDQDKELLWKVEDSKLTVHNAMCGKGFCKRYQTCLNFIYSSL